MRPTNLIPQYVAVEGDLLQIGAEEFDLRNIERIAVVGAGKAGAEMAGALETVLGDRVLRREARHRLGECASRLCAANAGDQLACGTPGGHQ